MRQARELIHVPNNYYHERQARLAETIVRHSFPGKVFFCNSGAEANEAAFKLARKWGNPARNQIISMEGSFHGRTLAAVAATGQKRIQEGFEPLPAGFSSIPFNDINALEKAVSPKTAAVIVEPIQGEGGVRVAGAAYLKAVRELCDREKLLLIFDEVQTAMGRTGSMFAYRHFGVTPDMVTLSKALGGGVPIGALIAKKEIADTLGPGTHGTTFGGSPLACAAALAVFEAIEKEKLLENAAAMGAYLLKKLGELKSKYPAVVADVRGIALMAGMELSIEGKPVYETCLKRGLLINVTQGNVLRIMPPLIVKKKEIDGALRILDEALAGVR
jgi:predicted acetylornithine/succinylornithine family transaminase